MRRPLRTLLLLGLLAGPAAAQDALRHVHPERDAEVPVSGYPTWIEDLTVGTPVADHGSHAGLKASLQTDAPVHANSALNAAHYSGFQAVAGQVDQSLLYVVEGDRALLAAPDERRVRFHPWGWEETARGDGLEVRGAVTTLATNAFLLVARITNESGTARHLAPRLAFSGYTIEARELETDRLLYKAARATRGLVPRVRLATRDGAPLRAPTARGLELTLDDPHGNLPPGPVRALLPGKAGWSLWGVGAGAPRRLPARTLGGALVLEVERTDAGPYRSYVLLPPGAPGP